MMQKTFVRLCDYTMECAKVLGKFFKFASQKKRERVTWKENQVNLFLGELSILKAFSAS